MDMNSAAEQLENKDNKNYKRSCIVKAIVFVLIFSVLLSFVSSVFTIDSDAYDYTLITSLYNEPEDSLDAVYVGSSNCYYYWNAPAAFEEYGITVLPFASSSQSVTIAEYMISEAMKTQPNALYIININTLGDEGAMDDASMHYLLDNMPFSVDKLKLTKHLTDMAGLSFSESLEYYFPLIRYHSRWNELKPSNFGNSWTDYKNGGTTSKYLNNVTDISETYKTTEETEELTESIYNSIINLMDFCDRENVNALFVTVPQARKDEEEVMHYNAINEIITSRGYPVLDLLNNIETTGINKQTDFYNEHHTNIHGSLKFTHYLSEYLVENYNFTDKRGNEEYKAWDDALVRYTKYFERSVLDFELDSGTRDYSLPGIEDISVESNVTDNALSWLPVEEADGYTVYRKVNKVWSKLGDTVDCIYIDAGDSEESEYGDTGAEEAAQSVADSEAQSFIDEKEKYEYTVVPYKEKDGKRLYGQITFFGVAVSE